MHGYKKDKNLEKFFKKNIVEKANINNRRLGFIGYHLAKSA